MLLTANVYFYLYLQKYIFLKVVPLSILSSNTDLIGAGTNNKQQLLDTPYADLSSEAPAPDSLKHFCRRRKLVMTSLEIFLRFPREILEQTSDYQLRGSVYNVDMTQVGRHQSSSSGSEIRGLFPKCR